MRPVIKGAREQGQRAWMTCGSIWSAKWVGQRRYLEMRLWGSCAYLRLFFIPCEGGVIPADRMLLSVKFFQIKYSLMYLTPFDIPRNIFFPFEAFKDPSFPSTHENTCEIQPSTCDIFDFICENRLCICETDHWPFFYLWSLSFICERLYLLVNCELYF